MYLRVNKKKNPFHMHVVYSLILNLNKVSLFTFKTFLLGWGTAYSMGQKFNAFLCKQMEIYCH